MCDEWMPVVKLAIPIDLFHQLPRNPAYKYEYFGSQAHLTPRPKFYHALVELARLPAAVPLPRDVTVRPVQEEDIIDLEHVFAGAFARQQPYASLEAERRLEAARLALAKVRSGVDGPWIRQASMVAVDKAHPIGAIFITLLPDEDPAEWDSFHWRMPPPEDWRQSQLGRPHVTWVFVSPWQVGHGTGTALLAAAADVLRQMGYRQLASTFLLGNESSMLWHWRNGFELQAYPGSQRRWEQRRKEQQFPAGINPAARKDAASPS
jgi:GNAT superfamily N-acetyltransferase